MLKKIFGPVQSRTETERATDLGGQDGLQRDGEGDFKGTSYNLNIRGMPRTIKKQNMEEDLWRLRANQNYET